MGIRVIERNFFCCFKERESYSREEIPFSVQFFSLSTRQKRKWGHEFVIYLSRYFSGLVEEGNRESRVDYYYYCAGVYQVQRIGIEAKEGYPRGELAFVYYYCAGVTFLHILLGSVENMTLEDDILTAMTSEKGACSLACVLFYKNL